jgi:hypothetical protein
MTFVMMKSTTFSRSGKEIPALLLDRIGREHGEQGASRFVTAHVSHAGGRLHPSA